MEYEQLKLFEQPEYKPEFKLASYDYILLAFSGGKDSTACFLDLLDQGVDLKKVELWHHDIDGREGDLFMDWEVTPSYCQAFADAFNVPIYFQWKEGGFERELLRKDCLTAPTKFETPEGKLMTVGGTRGKKTTRRKFPAASKDLNVRWCSAYLKIDPCTTAVINQPRFRNKRTLIISGERGQESPGRAKYATFEPDRADNRRGKQVVRHVDRYRPLVHKKEAWVWEIIERYKIRVHPAYYLGWGRVSCKYCIFGSKDQMATAYKISPCQGDKISDYEDEFGHTIKRIKKKNIPLKEFIAQGTPYEASNNTPMVIRATSYAYTMNIKMGKDEEWILPAGAYGESCGPT